MNKTTVNLSQRDEKGDRLKTESAKNHDSKEISDGFVEGKSDAVADCLMTEDDLFDLEIDLEPGPETALFLQ